MVVVEIQKLFASKLGAVVCDDAIRNPKRWTMSVKNSTTCSDLMLVIEWASMHLENSSMATSKWVKPPVVLFRGPTKSSPQTAYSHVMGIVYRA
jgi:hypothetical protein